MSKFKVMIKEWYEGLSLENKRLVYIIPISILAGILLCSFSSGVSASDRYYPESIEYNVDDYSGAVVGAVIGGQQFDLSSDRWQASATYGMVESSKAISIGIAKGWNGTLVTGSYAETIDEKSNQEKVRAAVVGANIKF